MQLLHQAPGSKKATKQTEANQVCGPVELHRASGGAGWQPKLIAKIWDPASRGLGPMEILKEVLKGTNQATLKGTHFHTWGTHTHACASEKVPVRNLHGAH